MLPRYRNLLVLIILGIALVVWLFSSLLWYLAAAVVLSSMLRPLTDYLDSLVLGNLKMPRILAVLVAFGAFIGVLALLVRLFAPLVTEEIKFVQHLDWQRLSAALQKPIENLEQYIINNVQPTRQPGFLRGAMNDAVAQVVSGLQLSELLNYLVQFTGSILAYIVIVGFISFLLLYEKGLIRYSFLRLVPNAYFEVVVTALYKIERSLTNYLLGLLIQMSIFFSVLTIGLSLTGTNYILPIALFAALINVIPYLGPAIGLLFGLLVVSSTGGIEIGWQPYIWRLLQVLPVFITAISLDNLVVQPVIFSRSVQAHPLAIFLAIFVGATLGGPWGMLVAIPLYTIFRIAYRELWWGYREYRVFKYR